MAEAVVAEVEAGEEPQAQNPRFGAALGASLGAAVPTEREAANFDRSS